MAIKWASEWLKEHSYRKALAKKEWDQGLIKPFVPNPRALQGFTYLCNICRETKSGNPFAIYDDDGYTQRYYCNPCCVGIGVAW